MAINKKIVAASGYFNPLHVGHLKYLKAASELGALTVIINNDKQVKLKGSIPFMVEQERVEIIKHLACVDRVVLSIDKDYSVRRTLQRLRPHFFVNGGDRQDGLTTPERDVCAQQGIIMVFKVGGGKTQSSSNLLNRNKKIKKPWGEEEILYKTDKTLTKILRINCHSRLSLQVHEKKDESMRILQGAAWVQIVITDSIEFKMKAGEYYMIRRSFLHRISTRKESAEILETSTGEDSDIHRIEDDYGRIIV